MGSYCSSKVPEISVKSDVEGNTCCDDFVCPSTCCVIIANSKKAKLKQKIPKKPGRKNISPNNI